MCGRYFIESTPTFEDYLRKALQNHPEPEGLVTKGDIYPSQTVLCLGRGKNGVMPGFLRWGYPSFNNKELINTRLETVEEKPLFSQNFKEFRCAILASGFYEWDKSHTQYSLSTSHDLIYLAGIYDLHHRGFSILTRPSYGELSTIHDRSPIILDETQTYQYIQNEINREDLFQIQPTQYMKIKEKV